MNSQVCYDFQSTGTCRFSDSCRFIHDSQLGPLTHSRSHSLPSASGSSHASPTTYGIPSPSSVDSSVHSSMFQPSDSLYSDHSRPLSFGNGSVNGNSVGGSSSLYPNSQSHSPPSVPEHLLSSSASIREISMLRDADPRDLQQQLQLQEEEWALQQQQGLPPRRRNLTREHIALMRQLQQQEHQQQQALLLQQQQIDRRICFAFRDSGFCKYGNNCRFLHIGQPGSGTASVNDLRSMGRLPRANGGFRSVSTGSASLFGGPASSKKFMHVCFYFRDSGRCPYGNECRYAHILPADADALNQDAYGPDGEVDDAELLDQYMQRLDVQTQQQQQQASTGGSLPLSRSAQFMPRSNGGSAYLDRPMPNSAGPHIRSLSSLQPSSTAFIKKGICFEFRDSGHCKFGSSCRFIHDFVSPSPAPHSHVHALNGGGYGGHGDGVMGALTPEPSHYLERQAINLINEEM